MFIILTYISIISYSLWICKHHNNIFRPPINMPIDTITIRCYNIHSVDHWFTHLYISTEREEMALFEHSYAGPTGRKKATDSLLISQEQQSTARMWTTVMMVSSLAVSVMAIMLPYSNPWPWQLSILIIAACGVNVCIYIHDDALRRDYPFYRLAATLVNFVGVMAIAVTVFTRVLAPSYGIENASSYVVCMLLAATLIGAITYRITMKRNR